MGHGIRIAFNALRRLSAHLRLPVAAAAFVCAGIASPAYAQVTETVLHAFSGGADGGSVYGGLLLDATGALSGTTGFGGNLSAALCPGVGCGTVFKLTPPARGQTTWNLTTLWNFSGTDGDVPLVGALFAPDESPFPLYGTTSGLSSGNGTVFRLTGRVLKTLWSFSGGSDGALPSGGLIRGESGALYGTTEGGGASGNGTVFAIGNSTGALTTIWSFSGGSDGAIPGGPLLRDQTGTLYGNTLGGGNFTAPICGIFFTGSCGVVFKLTPPARGQTAWTETPIWTFSGGDDGALPNGGLIADETGALYGTTGAGGAFPAGCGGGGCGTVFKLTPPAGDKAGWSLSTLYAFTGGSDGGSPCPRSSPTGPGRFMEPRMPAAPVASPSRVAASSSS
jgi:uncharacterized repeat protein (TIGR03803 family)